jgi:hypothetical protein
MTQLAGGEPLSSGSLTWNAPIAFLFGLRNAARTIDHLVAHRMHPSSAGDRFVGMMEYVAESFHDLLAGDSEAISDSNSSGGSHQPLRECFMADTPEGHVKSIHEGRTTPPNGPDDEVEGDARSLLRMQVE